MNAGNRNEEFARQWLRKARHDLFTAECVLDAGDGPTDTPAFHAQQAVEKALKGLLTAANVSFGRTHDLLPLLEAAADILPELIRFRFICAELSEYGVAVRYPGFLDDLPREDVAHATAQAARIVDLVENHLENRNWTFS